MNTEAKNASAQTEAKEQSTKQLGLSNEKASRKLSFHDFGCYPMELAKLEDGTGVKWSLTYWRKGLLQIDEMEETKEKALGWLKGKKVAQIMCRMIEINNQLNKKNG